MKLKGEAITTRSRSRRSNRDEIQITRVEPVTTTMETQTMNKRQSRWRERKGV